LYSFGTERSPELREFIRAIHSAEGIIIASPGYHGGMAGSVKNALDYMEDLRTEEPPYLSGRAVGCIATAGGWQAAVATIIGMRTLIHSLRGWPTPFGVAINTSGSQDGEPGVAERLQSHLAIVASEVLQFAQMSRLYRGPGLAASAGAQTLVAPADGASGIFLDAVPRWG
jgi:FMN reductase